MSIVITDLLGTDSFSGSRLTINANFQSLKGEVETLETNLGISTAAGNINVSTATGGQIKGKVGAFNTIQLPVAGGVISLDGVTGNVVLSTGTLTVPTVNLVTLGVTGNINQTAGSTVLEQTTFNGLATFTAGISLGSKVTVTAPTTFNVLLSDCAININGSGAVLLTPDASLTDGHTIVLVNSTGSCTLTTTNILGATSIAFNATGYLSSITLMYSLVDLKWIIIGSTNMIIS
jgi:hypothetical protein